MALEQIAIEPVLKYFCISKQIIKEQSSSFYFAFSKLPSYQAYSIFVIYDFLRQLDDAADTSNHSRFNELVLNWEKASQKNSIIINHQSNISEKVAYIFQTFSIDNKFLEDMIVGQQHDLNGENITTMTQLETYCYQVAGTVGCMIYSILSPNSIDAIKQKVIEVGIALQLTNILRDVHEDALEGRYFIPERLLYKYGVSHKELLDYPTSDNLKGIFKILSNKSLKNYEESQNIMTHISDRKSRVALELSIEVYKKILVKLIKHDFENITTRMYVTRIEKLVILGKILLKSY